MPTNRTYGAEGPPRLCPRKGSLAPVEQDTQTKEATRDVEDKGDDAYGLIGLLFQVGLPVMEPE
ncbi:hypothetical protein EFB08_17090 [Rufibacter latericius]|uniref:Uncharacterized protein n=1 Tax=Rufibacter latericius TaxID=2487040 RepID=A0A3M9MEV1_9BACT|nr:hypothetical protein EFB08_17090 [Rufibacter latericius]